MRILATLAVVLLLAACGTETDSFASGDPVPDPMPTEVPAATGMVSTRFLATVMDTGTPELCLGAVAESYPPQCGGIPLEGWDWADHDGVFEQEGEIRWGLFSVTGTFDGTTMVVRDAIPAALYDTTPQSEPDDCADGADGPSQRRLEEIQRELEELPGLLTSMPTPCSVHADVVHDDGTLQEWADATYGEGVVVITSALVPLGR